MQISHIEFRVLLRRASLSQAAFARNCDIHDLTVNRWAMGHVPCPSWLAMLLSRSLLVATDLPEMAWHETLAVDPMCDFATLKRTYRDLAKRYHPDLNGAKYTAVFQRLKAAFDEGEDIILERTLNDTSISEPAATSAARQGAHR